MAWQKSPQTNALDVLRASVDPRFYTATGDAPRWVQVLSKRASEDAGVLALLGPSGVSVKLLRGGRVRPLPDPAALLLVALVQDLRVNPRRIAVGLPPVALHLPLLLVSAAALAATVESGANATPKQHQGVLVVSPDLELRSCYCDLLVGNAELESAHPGSRMKPTGERVALRKSVGEYGACFFFPPLTLPPKISFRPGLVLLDMRYGRWTKRASDLARWAAQASQGTGVAALYSVGDDDTLGSLTDAGYIDIPLDHQAIATCQLSLRGTPGLAKSNQGKTTKRRSADNTDAPIDWSLADAPSLLNRDHLVIEIAGSEETDLLFSRIGQLLGEHASSDNLDLHRARWLFATLLQLPAPIYKYEEAARNLGRFTLRKTIERLGMFSRREPGLGAVVQSLRVVFDQLHRNLERANPRATHLGTLLKDTAQSIAPGHLLVLVRDRVAARALQSWLDLELAAHEEWLTSVDIRACSDYATSESTRFHSAIVSGALPRRYRWIAGGRLAPNVVFLTYPLESNVVQHHLDIYYSERNCELRCTKRQVAIGGTVPLTPEAQAAVPQLRLARPPSRVTMPERPKTKEWLEGLNELAEALESAKRASNLPDELPLRDAWREDAAEEEPVDTQLAPDNRDDPSEMISAVRLEVQSQKLGVGEIWLPADEPVECSRPSSPEDLKRLSPGDLLQGDVLVRVDENGRGTLFERVADLVDSQREYRELAAYRRAWREAIQNICARYRSERGVNYGDALSALQQNGATITSELAVRFWVRGFVIGPENSLSIKAVGLVGGVQALVSHAKDFDRAFTKIRSTHCTIGRWLTNAIRRSRQQLAGAKAETLATELDERLRIPLEELLETLDFAQVIAVDPTVVRVRTGRVGMFTSSR